MDEWTCKALEAVIGKRVVGVEEENSWPVLRFDDGSRLVFTDDDCVNVNAQFKHG